MTVLDPTIGPLVSPWDVEQAVLTTLRTWLPFYLYRTEDYHAGESFQGTAVGRGSLPRPPATESYYGGADFESWEERLLPSLVVIAEPLDAVERSDPAGYGQDYELQVAAIVKGELEDDTRQLTNYYGAAVMLTLTQHGSLGGFANRTSMVRSPKIEFADPDRRVFQQAVSLFHCLVAEIANAELGPATFPGYPGAPPIDPSLPLPPWVEITETIIEIDAGGPFPESDLFPDSGLLP